MLLAKKRWFLIVAFALALLAGCSNYIDRDTMKKLNACQSTSDVERILRHHKGDYQVLKNSYKTSVLRYETTNPPLLFVMVDGGILGFRAGEKIWKGESFVKEAEAELYGGDASTEEE